jgi:predicted ATPase
VLTELSLERFKGWKTTGPLRLAPITLLFGANSSGKTSIIQALLLLKQTAESADRSRVLHTGDERTLVDLGTVSDLLYRHEPDESLSIGLQWKNVPLVSAAQAPEKRENQPSTARLAKIPDQQEAPATIGFTVKIRASTDAVHVESATYRLGRETIELRRKHDEQEKPAAEEPTGTATPSAAPPPPTPASARYELATSQFKLKRRKGRVWPLPAPVRFYGFPQEVTNYFQNADWLTDLALALENQLARIQYVGPLRERPWRSYKWAGEQPENVGTSGELAVHALLAARSAKLPVALGEGKGRRYKPFHEVIAGWLTQMHMLDSFAVRPIAKGRKEYEVRVRRAREAPEVDITDVGFGVSQVLPVLVQSFYATANSTVIYEQPEIHLHPSIQADLADVLIEASRGRDVQFIVETHSEHLLRRLQRRIAEGEKLSNQDVAIYFCRAEAGNSIIEELKVDEFGNVTNWPEDFFGDTLGDLKAMTVAGIERRQK